MTIISFFLHVVWTDLVLFRCIYGYFTGACMEEIPSLPFKMHHVYQLSPGVYGGVIILSACDNRGA